ncbi:MAG: energy transducer TonB [Acidobacteria bacterium]|nr:energy transducer TonB [Acidobacteriota bacterium]
MSISVFPQDPAFEEKAVSMAQAMPVKKFDPRLPERSLIAWLGQITGQRAGINWQLSECGEAVDKPVEINACVDVTATISETKKIFIQILVGTFSSGLIGESKIRFIAIEQKGQLFAVSKLADLPDLIKTEIIRPRPIPVILPVARRQPINPALSGQYLNSLAGSSIKPPAMLSTFTNDIPKPLPRRVSEGVLLGNIVNKIMPVYPFSARQLKIQGEVRVEIVIEETGRVIEARAVDGHPMLRQAAEEAARKWTFNPTYLNGKAVRTQGILRFVFSNP